MKQPHDGADRLDALRREHIPAATFIEYQFRAWQTALPSAQRLEYLLPGLSAEVGELMDIFAKHQRDHSPGAFTDKEYERIEKEAGDILWMVSSILRLMDISLDEVARKNLAKLADRKVRGVIRGSGDER